MSNSSRDNGASTSGTFCPVLKGARIDLGIQEPPHITVRGGRDPFERAEPGAMETLLELDQVRAVHAAPLAESVMREAELLTRALYAGRDQRQRSVAEEGFQFGRSRQRSGVLLRSWLRVK